MLLEKSLMAMANKIIPNTFSITAIPPTPNNRSIRLVNFRVKKMSGIFRAIAMIILTVSYYALKEIRVENVPAPAIIGKAKGTMDAAFSVPSFCLNKRMPKIISMAMKKRMNEPATANELTSTPKSPRNFSPTNRKTTINTKDTTVVVMG